MLLTCVFVSLSLCLSLFFFPSRLFLGPSLLSARGYEAIPQLRESVSYTVEAAAAELGENMFVLCLPGVSVLCRVTSLSSGALVVL